jgi:hypothetical protein
MAGAVPRYHLSFIIASDHVVAAVSISVMLLASFANVGTKNSFPFNFYVLHFERNVLADPFFRQRRGDVQGCRLWNSSSQPVVYFDVNSGI